MSTDQYAQHWHEARHAAALAGHEIIEHGWEQHVIIDHDQKVVYRYPRHAAAAAKLADEVALLKTIHEQTWSTQLPVMREHSELRTVYDYIPGQALSRHEQHELTDVELTQIGTELGTFLAQLHALNLAIIDKKQTKHSTSLLDYYKERIEPATDSEFHARAMAVLSELTHCPFYAEPAVLHGDLHGLNIIIDHETKQLNGVIDLSEMEVGDPHQDFRKLFMTNPLLLDPAIAAYQAAGGQKLSRDQTILWAYVNEWANACYFSSSPENPTYQRALGHLKHWGQV